MNQCICSFNGRDERVTVYEGLTVQQAFADVADELGLDTNANITYRAGAQTIPGNSPATPGAKYIANVKREDKGE